MLLNIYRWKICRIVIFKYDFRCFINDLGEGDIVSFNIQDNTDEINFLKDDDCLNPNRVLLFYFIYNLLFTIPL